MVYCVFYTVYGIDYMVYGMYYTRILEPLAGPESSVL